MENGLTIYQPGKAVLQRRAIVADLNNLAMLQPVERDVYKATTGLTIEEYNDVDLLQAMQKVLLVIAKDIGIRDTRNEEWNVTIVRITKLAQRYYPTFTIKDFQFAFELAVTGELNDWLPKDRFGNPDKEHFQMFNADYFCKIVNAYKGYRNSIINRVNANLKKPEPTRNPENERLYEAGINKDIIGCFLYFKYHGRLPAISPVMEMLAYERLAKAGLAEDFEVTEQEQQTILRRTIFELSQKQMYGDIKRLKEQKTKAPEIQYPALALSRRKALIRAFEFMIDEEIQIKDYIKWD